MPLSHLIWLPLVSIISCLHYLMWLSSTLHSIPIFRSRTTLHMTWHMMYMSFTPAFYPNLTQDAARLAVVEGEVDKAQAALGEVERSVAREVEAASAAQTEVRWPTRVNFNWSRKLSCCVVCAACLLQCSCGFAPCRPHATAPPRVAVIGTATTWHGPCLACELPCCQSQSFVPHLATLPLPHSSTSLSFPCPLLVGKCEAGLHLTYQPLILLLTFFLRPPAHFSSFFRLRSASQTCVSCASGARAQGVSGHGLLLLF